MKYAAYITYGGLALFYLWLVVQKDYTMAQWVFIVILAIIILVLLLNAESARKLADSQQKLIEVQRTLATQKDTIIELLVDHGGLRDQFDRIKAESFPDKKP